MTSIDIKRLREDLSIHTKLCNQELEFRTTWGLFSPREIDDGTQLLLRYMDINANSDCLDLGCGYGPIGVTMAKLAPQGKTLLVDKDFMAVEYSRKNITLNHADNAEAILSNSFDHIPAERRFDIIASNIPAKVGKELLTLILHDAYEHLNPGGRIYVVTINGLRQFMKRYLNEIFGNYEKLKQGKSYTVACGQKPA